jgi:hypothetical protein
LANANWIDALLNSGPDWNYLTSNGTTFRTTINYTFDMSSGTQSGVTTASAFNTTQMAAARSILSYVHQLTGIVFQETANGSTADLHFADRDLSYLGANTAGVCSSNSSYGTIGSSLASYSAQAYVYLDNRPSSASYLSIQNPSAGNFGYEDLLHEIGHALGLKHPFETTSDNFAKLDSSQDKTSNTVMSYTSTPNVYYSTFQGYDIAALDWLYGKDGLGGNWGVGTNGTYWDGTSGNETFTFAWTPSNGYNYSVQGLGGTDTVALSVPRSSVLVSFDGTWLTLAGATGSNKMYIASDVENVQFSDGTRGFFSLAMPHDDYSGDGKSDILWRNAATGENALWDSGNSASGHFLTAVADPNWKMVGLGDFAGDGKSDILWRNSATGQIALWDSGNSATGHFLTAVVDVNWKVVGIGDFAGDGKSDMLWRNSATGENALWDNGNSAGGHFLTAIADLNWKMVGIADFAGDGKSDMLWRNSATGQNAVWDNGNSAGGHFLATVADPNWKMVGIGDLGGDGKADILWRNTSTGQDAVWDSGDSANGRFLAPVADQNWKVAELGDFVNDGKADILWRNTATGQNAVWDNGDSAAGHFLTTVTDLNWHITSQINALLTGDGLYLV